MSKQSPNKTQNQEVLAQAALVYAQELLRKLTLKIKRETEANLRALIESAKEQNEDAQKELVKVHAYIQSYIQQFQNNPNSSTALKQEDYLVKALDSYQPQLQQAVTIVSRVVMIVPAAPVQLAANSTLSIATPKPTPSSVKKLTDGLTTLAVNGLNVVRGLLTSSATLFGYSKAKAMAAAAAVTPTPVPSAPPAPTATSSVPQPTLYAPKVKLPEPSAPPLPSGVSVVQPGITPTSAGAA